MFSLLLDILVAILLVVTIVYAVLLNRRLGVLRQDRAELERLTLTFADALRRAEDGIGRLKTTADALQDRIDRAQSLRDDLAFLTERGGSAADRLEDLVRTARKEAGVGPATAPAARAGLSAATAAAAAAAVPEGPKPRPSAPPPKTDPTLKAPAETRPAPRNPLQGLPEPRSEAERELLKALESAR
jgi:hypothetical protein